MNFFNIIQANIQSLRKNKEELKHLTQTQDIHGICLQETWTKKIRILKYQGTSPLKQIGQMAMEEAVSL